MKCNVIKSGNTVAIVCGRGFQKKCSQPDCSRPGGRLCDFKLTNGKTCDRPICIGHAVKQGPDLDLCPPHSKMVDDFSKAVVGKNKSDAIAKIHGLERKKGETDEELDARVSAKMADVWRENL